ncbi:MAG: HNH endonuclease [Thermomicrobia bacterium]|nr:HNH endonuclease [Thermomicrobia bacterium]
MRHEYEYIAQQIDSGTYVAPPNAEITIESVKRPNWYDSRPWQLLSSTCKQRDGYRCVRCGEGDAILHAHHVIHRSDGGSDDLDNLITLCVPCHRKEHGRYIPLFPR